jgi:hypothetical protein
MHDSVPNYSDGFNEHEIKKRLKHAVANGITSCIITGTGEPLQNREYLIKLVTLFRKMDYPFTNVEIQTTGVLLNLQKNGKFINIDLLKDLYVNTISLSVSDIFDDENNAMIIGMPKKEKYNLLNKIFWLKISGFNIRLSLNMTNAYDNRTPEEILIRCKELAADQITFRELYASEEETDESIWVTENACSPDLMNKINIYIAGGTLYPTTPNHSSNGTYYTPKGIKLYDLPFGSSVYSIKGMSVVIDDDCMSKEENQSLKYFILRENNKLYCRWDDKGSLIF